VSATLERRGQGADRGGIYAPGAIVSEVARRLNISPQHLFAWRESARAGALGLPADTAPLFVRSSRWWPFYKRASFP